MYDINLWQSVMDYPVIGFVGVIVLNFRTASAILLIWNGLLEAGTYHGM